MRFSTASFPPFASAPFAKSPRGFTLIELLAVLAIVGIMVSLGTAAFSSINRSRGVENGGNLLVAMVNQARQNSISKGVLTALVMPKSVAGTEVNYGAFALAEKAPGDAEWKPLTPWGFLPDGIVADRGRSETFVDQTPSFTPPPTENLPRLPGRGVSTKPGSADWAYQVFLPDGRLSINGLATTSTVPTLYLIEKAKGSTAKNYYKVEINLLTGNPHIERP